MLNYYLYETLFFSFPDFTFYCLLILDLREICKNVSIPFILFTQLPDVNILHNHSTIVKTKKLTWVQYS